MIGELELKINPQLRISHLAVAKTGGSVTNVVRLGILVDFAP